MQPSVAKPLRGFRTSARKRKLCLMCQVSLLHSQVLSEETQRIGRQSRFLLSAGVDGMILSGSLSDLQQSILPDASGYATSTALQQQSGARFPGSQLTTADHTLSPPAALQQPRQAYVVQQQIQQEPQPQVQQEQEQIMQVVAAPAKAPAAFMAKLHKTSKGSESKPGSAFAAQNEGDGSQQPLKEATESRRTLEQVWRPAQLQHIWRVTGLSGKMRIHNLPPRRAYRYIGHMQILRI